MTDSLALTEVEFEQRSFITKVYGWMATALLITAFVAFYVVSTPSLFIPLVTNRTLFMALIIGELLLVGYLVVAIKKMSAAAATATFIGYSALNGLTLSLIFMVYTMSSISTTFFITASTFAIMSFYGYTTKRDLTSIGNLCIMGMVGIVIASIVNFFFFNETFYWVTTYIGILVFVGLIAYDTQKIKNINIIGNEGTEEERKFAIMGALALYLDFINLFLFLLRIFGRKK
jgi:FtsH-binding integral membrane protein